MSHLSVSLSDINKYCPVFDGRNLDQPSLEKPTSLEESKDNMSWGSNNTSHDKMRVCDTKNWTKVFMLKVEKVEFSSFIRVPHNIVLDITELNNLGVGIDFVNFFRLLTRSNAIMSTKDVIGQLPKSHVKCIAMDSQACCA